MSTRRCMDWWSEADWMRTDGQVPAHALPGDTPKWPRDRDVDIKHTCIDVTLDVPAKRVSGTVTHTVAPFNDGLRSVAFDAMEMTIHDVTAAGKEATFDNDGRRVLVEFPEPVSRGHEIRVAITYEAQPRIGMYFVGPDDAHPDKPVQVWTQGQDEDSKHWFPCFDSPNQKATTELKATVPGDWFVLSNGRLLNDKRNKDGTRTFHWHQDRPHATYLITLVAGLFARIDASRPGLTIDYFVEGKDRETASRTFANTPQMVELFEEVTGMPYPWAKYSQVVVRDFVFGGMENTSATTMTENILLDEKATVDVTSDPLISHELAHMWFGDLLTCRAWSHGWLNESFATFLEMLWTERRLGQDEYVREAFDNTERYLGERYRRPIVANVYHEPIDIFDRHLYEKGSLVLYMLRHLLGDEPFFRSIRRYVARNQDRNVITQDLIDAIAEETGRNLDWFFDQWVFRPGHPKLKVSWQWDDAQGVATVTVKQTQSTDDGTAVFRLPVTIDFTFKRGRPRAFSVEITEREQSFSFPLPSKPVMCRFDPGYRVLAELEFDKPVAELVTQVERDEAAGRIRACASLGKKGGPEAVRALEERVMRDRFWGVQAAAAKALGEMRGEQARDALLRSITVRHPKARRAVVAALGEFRGDERVFEALQKPSQRDASWLVEAEANKSIGKTRVDGAFEAIERNFRRPSFRSVVRNGCIDGLVELRDERGFALLSEAAAYGQPFQSRPPAATGIAKLALHFPGRKKRAGDELVGLLHDPDFRVRLAAANGLGTLGDESFAPELDRMAERELDGRGVRTAREQAQKLRTGATTTDEVRRLREDLETLRAENVKLRDRLERIEARDGSSAS